MAAVIQRPLRGSRTSSFYPIKQLPSLSSLDSAFQLQEYISLLIRLDVHDVDAIVSLPGKRAGKDRDSNSENSDTTDEQIDSKTEDNDGEKGKGDATVDEACWIYEQLRRLAQDLTHPLITTLQQECTRASCPEMKAGEWLYLCVAHGNDGAMEQCCAIDYILHTLDSATALLNSPRAFPSRLQIPQTSHRHFSSLARRLGRIFAHAYFHHREAFEQAEAESSLYARFLALTSKFDLVPPEFLVIPSSALGGSGSDDEDERGAGEVQPPRLLAAAVHPAAERVKDKESEKESGERNREPLQQQHLSADPPPDRKKSKSPPSFGLGIAGNSTSESGSGLDSPRRVGRSRTDTMVLSEASMMGDELARFGEEEEVALKTARPELDGWVDIGVSPEDSLGPEAEIKGVDLGMRDGEDEDGEVEPISPTDEVVSGSSSLPLEDFAQPSASPSTGATVPGEQTGPPDPSAEKEEAELTEEVEEVKVKGIPPPEDVQTKQESQVSHEPSVIPTPTSTIIEMTAINANGAEVEHVEVSAPTKLDETAVEKMEPSPPVETPAEPETALTSEAPAVEAEASSSSEETSAPPASDDPSPASVSEAETVAPPPPVEEDAAAPIVEETPTPAAPVEETAGEISASEVTEFKAETSSEPTAAPEPSAPGHPKPATPAPTIELEAKSFAAAAKAATEPKVEDASNVKAAEDETKEIDGGVEGGKA